MQPAQRGLDAPRATVAISRSGVGLGTQTITTNEAFDAPGAALLALLYAAGARPSAAEVSAIASRSGEFAVVFEGPSHEGWVEALVTGLSFDVVGLAPGESMPSPDVAHRCGFAAAPGTGQFEAIAIRPGPHLAGGANMLPVVRACLGLAKALAGASRTEAVVWLPARIAAKPRLFAATVDDWLEGGAFPAPVLTALIVGPNGGVTSEGLAFFIGQEVELAGSPGTGAADDVKLAARLVHELVNNGPLRVPTRLTGANGEPLFVEPSADGRTVSIRREGIG